MSHTAVHVVFEFAHEDDVPNDEQEAMAIAKVQRLIEAVSEIWKVVGDTCGDGISITGARFIDGEAIPVVGQRYTDDSHPGENEFTIIALEKGDAVAELDNDQWYALHGPEGLLKKLATGVVRPVKQEA